MKNDIYKRTAAQVFSTKPTSGERPKGKMPELAMGYGQSATELHDKSPMPFGKYKGKALIDVPAKYLLWLADNGCDHAGVKQYILNNLAALRKEAGIK